MAPSTQLVTGVPGPDELNLCRFIKEGTEPIDIRAGAIEDMDLVRSILIGSKTKRIRILRDKITPEISKLSKAERGVFGLQGDPKSGTSMALY